MAPHVVTSFAKAKETKLPNHKRLGNYQQEHEMQRRLQTMCLRTMNQLVGFFPPKHITIESSSFFSSLTSKTPPCFIKFIKYHSPGPVWTTWFLLEPETPLQTEIASIGRSGRVLHVASAAAAAVSQVFGYVCVAPPSCLNSRLLKELPRLSTNLIPWQWDKGPGVLKH